MMNKHIPRLIEQIQKAVKQVEVRKKELDQAKAKLSHDEYELTALRDVMRIYLDSGEDNGYFRDYVKHQEQEAKRTKETK